MVNVNFVFIDSYSNSSNIYNVYRVLHGKSELIQAFNQLEYSVFQTILDKHILNCVLPRIIQFYQVHPFIV